MIKDIPTYTVEDIAIAVVKELNEDEEMVWNVYMLNLKDKEIEGVLVSSNGYGELNGEKVRTSTLRHFLDKIPAKSFRKVEPIVETVFGLSNEYWVSFFIDNVMYDKKYIFLAETIKEEYFINIPLINKKGVMIK
jgi:hypothetical protein